MENENIQQPEQNDGWFEELLGAKPAEEKELGLDESAIYAKGLVHPADIELEKIIQEAKAMETEMPAPESETYIPEDFLWEDELQYSPVSKLDGDRKTAMKKMAEIEKIRKMLPAMDCGACGCPTCSTLAEDIVKGKATLKDCVVLLKEQYLAEKEDEDEDDD